MGSERRIYWRGKRAWGDFRAWEDVGGKREPLAPVGAQRGTTDETEAAILWDARAEELERKRRSARARAVHRPDTLRGYAPTYLVAKAQESDPSDSTMIRAEQALRSLLNSMVDDKGNELNPRLTDIRPADVRTIMRRLRTYISPHTGRPLSSRSQLYAISTLQELFDWAVMDGIVASNPLKELPRKIKPRAGGNNTDFLETVEGAAVLDALLQTGGGIVARVVLSFCMALAGLRWSEATGLRASDIDFARRVIVVAGNEHRKVKTRAKGHRAVPLWPQLEMLLRAYLQRHPRIGATLLCPTQRGERTAPIKDVRSLYRNAFTVAKATLDSAGIGHELGRANLTPQVWRVTYCSARLQTTDHGAPVADVVVQGEMGHTSMEMITRVYGRVGRERRRLPVVEYRLPNGLLAGEAECRRILGDVEVDRILRAGEPDPAARLRSV
jgi:integrase